MRVAEICPDCAVYTNSVCTVYNGVYLSNINASPLDTLDTVLANIDLTFPTPTGAGVPSNVPNYIGQLYFRTDGTLYIGLSTTVPNWGLVGTVITTTTTSTTSAP